MADTTHNVTIKATLDTSTNDSQGRARSPSGGSGNAASAISMFGAAGITMTKTLQLLKTAFEAITYSMSELNKRVQVISWMYRKVNSSIDKNNSEFKKLTSRVQYLQTKSKTAIENFKKMLDQLSATVSQTTEMAANSEQAKVDSAKKVIRAQEKQAQAANKAADSANKQSSILEKSITNFMKWAMVSQAAGNISRNFGELADLSPTKSEETIYKWISRIGHVLASAGTGAGAGAGIGAAAGSVSGPGTLITTTGGAVIGGLFGLYSGINDELNKFTKETEDNTNELAQSTTEFSKSQEEISKSIQKTIEKIRRDTRDDVLSETAPEKLESTLAMLEDNILRITQDISELNSRFVLGKISLNDYNTAIEDMNDKLAREKAIRDELSTRYEHEQDREISEIQRQTQNFDYISELLYKQIELGKQESNSKVMRDGTWQQVLQALAEQNQLNLFEQSRSKGFFTRMQDANFKQDWLAYDEAKMEFEESQRNLAFGLQLRSGLASTLQEIFKEMMTYKGLNIRDFGSLAALGGFGSTSVLGDPMLDLQREQNRLLSEMLRTIRDQDNSARYL